MSPVRLGVIGDAVLTAGMIACLAILRSQVEPEAGEVPMALAGLSGLLVFLCLSDAGPVETAGEAEREPWCGREGICRGL